MSADTGQLSQELPGLYRGPVEEVLSYTGRIKRILDVGCGTVRSFRLHT